MICTDISHIAAISQPYRLSAVPPLGEGESKREGGRKGEGSGEEGRGEGENKGKGEGKSGEGMRRCSCKVKNTKTSVRFEHLFYVLFFFPDLKM